MAASKRKPSFRKVPRSASTEEPFDLDDAQLGELASRIAADDAGHVEVVLGRTGSRR